MRRENRASISTSDGPLPSSCTVLSPFLRVPSRAGWTTIQQNPPVTTQDRPGDVAVRRARSRVRSVQSPVPAEPSRLRKFGSKRRNVSPCGCAVPPRPSGKVSARRSEPREHSTDQSPPTTTCTKCMARSSRLSSALARPRGVPARLPSGSAQPPRAVAKRPRGLSQRPRKASRLPGGSARRD